MDKKYSFIEWEDTIYSDDYNAIRSNVLEMCILLIKALENGKSNNKLYNDYLNLLSCKQEEKLMYDEDFFVRYLKNIMGLFAMECTESYSFFSERFVKEIASLWESSARPVYGKVIEKQTVSRKVKLDRSKAGRLSAEHKDHSFYACHATMKLVRNWTGHQGINDIKVLDAGLLFLVCMRGLFNIDSIDKSLKEEYENYEKRICDMFEKDSDIKPACKESFKYICKLNDSTKEGSNDSTDIYERISGLGHSSSTIRRSVSMDEIYMLLYHTLCKDANTGVYLQIEDAIKCRTWKDWKERYDKRFSTYLQ